MHFVVNPWPRQSPELPSSSFFATGHYIRDPQMLLVEVLAKPQFIPGFHLLILFQKQNNPSDFWMQPLIVHRLPGSVQVEVDSLKYLHGTTPGKGVSADDANQTDTWAKPAGPFHLLQHHQGLSRGWSELIWDAGPELDQNMAKAAPRGPAELCGTGCTALPAQGSLWGSLLSAGLFLSFTLEPNLATRTKWWSHMAKSSGAVNPQCYYQDRGILKQLLRCRSVYMHRNPSGILKGAFSFKNAPPTPIFFAVSPYCHILLLPLLSPSKESKHVPFPAKCLFSAHLPQANGFLRWEILC